MHVHAWYPIVTIKYGILNNLPVVIKSVTYPNIVTFWVCQGEENLCVHNLSCIGVNNILTHNATKAIVLQNEGSCLLYRPGDTENRRHHQIHIPYCCQKKRGILIRNIKMNSFIYIYTYIWNDTKPTSIWTHPYRKWVLKSWFVRMNPITTSKCGGGPFLYKQKAIIGDYLDQNQLTTGTHDWAIYYLLISSTNQHQY